MGGGGGEGGACTEEDLGTLVATLDGLGEVRDLDLVAAAVPARGVLNPMVWSPAKPRVKRAVSGLSGPV